MACLCSGVRDPLDRSSYYTIWCSSAPNCRPVFLTCPTSPAKVLGFRVLEGRIIILQLYRSGDVAQQLDALPAVDAPEGVLKGRQGVYQLLQGG